MSSRKTTRLEVHEHSFTSGRRANRSLKLVHSHERGDVPHEHPDTGPATYTIDKREWARTTGLRGGGKKRFTAAPIGEQLPMRELEESELDFNVIVVPSRNVQLDGKRFGDGPGVAPIMRMVLGHKLKPRLR